MSHIGLVAGQSNAVPQTNGQFGTTCGSHPQMPFVHAPAQQSLGCVQLAPLAAQQLPPTHWPLQQSPALIQALLFAVHPQTPLEQLPLQQLALLLHAEAPPLQGAHTPPRAHTPLQHSDPLVQLPPSSVHAHVPLLHTPLQHGSLVQSCALSAHPPPPPPPPPSGPVGPVVALQATATTANTRSEA